ncbi:MAG TPA: hypothetical protein VF981_02350 [Gemmatimonadaceae bacterium]
MVTQHLDVVLVSRKTPRDGKLEISESAAAVLRDAVDDFTVSVGEIRAHGTMESLACTCSKVASATSHVHHFIVSPVLQSLPVGIPVAVGLDRPSGTVHVTGC